MHIYSVPWAGGHPKTTPGSGFRGLSPNPIFKVPALFGLCQSTQAPTLKAGWPPGRLPVSGAQALKSDGGGADTSHMPISVTMPFTHESDSPGTSHGGESPATNPSSADGMTPERLQEVVRRLESGFYETPEVRKEIARKVRKELDP